jgi:hypothetical protein
VADDIGRAKFEFDQMVAEAQRTRDELAQLAAQARAAGDELLATTHEGNAARVGGPAAKGSQARAGDEAALARENQLMLQRQKLDAENLETTTATTRALQEQAVAVENLQRRQVIVPTGPRYGSRGATAGGQFAAEEEAARLSQLEATLAASRASEIDPTLSRALAASNVAQIPRNRAYSDPSQSAGAAATREYEAQAQAAREEVAARQAALDLQREQEAESTRQLQAQERLNAALIEQRKATAYQVGAAAGSAGLRVSPRVQGALASAPAGVSAGAWTAADAEASRYNTTLGQFDALNARASISTEALTANLTRLGIADAEASNQLRKHGALTTEFLGALARGETTVSEFGYQIGATIGKFAGWAGAAALTYGAFEAVSKFASGALDTESAVQRLQRTIDNVNPEQAGQAIQKLSADTNVDMKEAGDAVFQFSRTFHNVDEASGAARLGLAALKLDNVALSDSVRASTAITQQFGGGLGTLTNVYNELSAAQREYNARISDMIPLLQKSSGAVHNAGGDLTQLIQLGTYATRVTQQGGSQVGTGLYRSASNFLSPSTSQGQTNEAALRNLGIQVTDSYTQTLINAIRRAQETGPDALTAQQRGALSIDVFGKQFGGRFSALFNPAGTDTFNKVTGGGPGGINPTATKGSLQEELTRELNTAGERAKAFGNELERLGGAFADTGAINLLISGLGVLTSSLSVFRGVLDVFDKLPGPVKEAVAGLTTLRLAMLFFSRTRLGSTTPLITRIPGFRPSEATLARGTLAIGTRNALSGVENDLAQTTSRAKALAANTARLSAIAAEEQEALGPLAEADQKAIQSVNDTKLQIIAQQRESVALDREAAVLEDQKLVLQKQLTGITRTTRKGRTDDPQILALQRGVKAAPDVSTEVDESSAGTSLFARSKARLAVAMGRNAAVSEEAAAAAGESAAASAKAAVASNVETGAVDAGTAATTGIRSRLRGVASSIGGMASAIDPMTAALIGLPFAYSILSSAADSAKTSLDHNTAALLPAVNSLAALQAAVKANAQAIAHPGSRDYSQTDSGVGKFVRNIPVLGKVGLSIDDEVGKLFGQQNDTSANKEAQGEYSAYAYAWKHLQAQLTADANRYQSLKEGSKTFNNQVVAAETAFTRVVDLDPNADRAGKVSQGFTSFALALQKQAESSRNLGNINKGNPFAQFKPLSASDIEKQITYADDFAKNFGDQGSAGIKRAIYAYTYLADKLGKGGLNDADLQKLGTAQQNLIETLSKTVTDLTNAAASAPTAQGANIDYSRAYAAIKKQGDYAGTALAAIIKQNSGDAEAVKRARETAAQQIAQINAAPAAPQGSLISLSKQDQRAIVEAQLNVIVQENKGNAEAIKRAKQTVDQLQTQIRASLDTVIQGQLGVLSNQSQVDQAKVTGSSPESQIRQAQINLNGIRQQMALAEREGASNAVIGPLQQQYYTALNTLRNQQSANASAIVDAQGSLALSQIGGTSPAADIARARQTVTNAQAKLAADSRSGAGEVAIINDQAALNNAVNSLNSTLQSDAQNLAQEMQSLIDAQVAFQQSQTEDPIKQAREQLQGDIRKLSTIKRSDYPDQKQYETALLNARAAVGKDRQGVNDALVQQQEGTLQFELNTDKIGDQQYINGLQQILKTRKLSLSARQQLLTEIYQAKNSMSQDMDLNVGNIKLPSVYQIRRAIGLGKQGELPGAQNTTVNHTASVTVNVYGAKGAQAVGKVLDDHLNTSVRASMRAAGVVGGSR